MKMPHEGFGEEMAHRAGVEAPRCWVCDRFITDLADLRHTSRGFPLCVECLTDIDDRIKRHNAALPLALQDILNGKGPDAHL